MKRYEILQSSARTTIRAEDEVKALLAYFDLLRIPGDDTKVDFKVFEWTLLNAHAWHVRDPNLGLNGADFHIIEVTDPDLQEM